MIMDMKLLFLGNFFSLLSDFSLATMIEPTLVSCGDIKFLGAVGLAQVVCHVADP